MLVPDSHWSAGSGWNVDGVWIDKKRAPALTFTCTKVRTLAFSLTKATCSLSFFVCLFVFNSLMKPAEKAMATHSSTLAWKIPCTEEPGKLQSRGSLRVGLNWASSLSLFTFIHWRRKWQPTPVFLPGESQEPGSLMGCCLWGRTELDTTEVI